MATTEEFQNSPFCEYFDQTQANGSIVIPDSSARLPSSPSYSPSNNTCWKPENVNDLCYNWHQNGGIDIPFRRQCSQQSSENSLSSDVSLLSNSDDYSSASDLCYKWHQNGGMDIPFRRQSSVNSQSSDVRLPSYYDDYPSANPPPYEPEVTVQHKTPCFVTQTSQLSASPNNNNWPFFWPNSAAFSDIDVGIRDNMIVYLTSGKVSDLVISDENLDTYLHLSTQMKLHVVREACEKRYLRTLLKENCLKLLQRAETYECQTLFNEAISLATKYFGELWKTNDFQYLGRNVVFLLLQNKGVHSHPEVYEALRKWLEYEKETRSHDYGMMLSCLRMSGVPPWFRSLPEYASSDSNQNAPLNTTIQFEVMFTWNDKEKLEAIILDLANFCVTSSIICQGYSPGPEFGVCCYEIDKAPYIFLCGGKGKASRDALCYDVVMNKWKKCGRMKVGRSRHGVVSVGKYVYVFGGYEAGTHLASIEKYDILSDNWKKVSQVKLLYPVRSAAFAVYSNVIYIFGGKVEGDVRISVAQCFDPSTGTVRCLDALPWPCAAGKAVTLGDFIYIASGDGKMCRFDPKTETYKSCADQPVTSSQFAMFVRDSDVYIAGGMQDLDTYFGCVHRYRPGEDSWTLHQNLTKGTPVFGTCALRQRPFQSRQYNFLPWASKKNRIGIMKS